MANSLSITVHPEPIKGEYLAVSDAMQQVLDFIEALEKSETVDGSDRQIVWRLTNAHTNSPPFTVVAEPYSIDPTLSVALEAHRATAFLSSSLADLLQGTVPDWLDGDIGRPLRRVFERNMDGVGRTEIVIDGTDRIDITPQAAKFGLIALDQIDLERDAAQRNWARTDFGAVEGRIHSLTHWNDKPALIVIERLSDQKFTCVLTADLAEQVGPDHDWREAWEGRRIIVGGALHYNGENVLKRVDANHIEIVDWSDVTVAQLRGIDILDGRSVSDHLNAIRGERLG